MAKILILTLRADIVHQPETNFGQGSDAIYQKLCHEEQVLVERALRRERIMGSLVLVLSCSDIWKS